MEDNRINDDISNKYLIAVMVIISVLFLVSVFVFLVTVDYSTYHIKGSNVYYYLESDTIKSNDEMGLFNWGKVDAVCKVPESIIYQYQVDDLSIIQIEFNIDSADKYIEHYFGNEITEQNETFDKFMFSCIEQAGTDMDKLEELLNQGLKAEGLSVKSITENLPSMYPRIINLE